MKVMVLVKANAESEAGELPSPEILERMGQYNEQLMAAGLLVAGEGLRPSSAGVRVRFGGPGENTVIDGPFAETKELLAGFWIWQVDSLEHAIEWIKKSPFQQTEIELRPVFDTADFAEVMTPEQRESEARLRAVTLGLEPPRYEDVPAMTMAGLNETYTFDTRVNIPEQWGRFSHHFGKVPAQIGDTYYGVSWNYRPCEGFDYLTAAQVEAGAEQPSEFTTLELAAQRYAIFPHNKHVSELATTIDAIWRKWLPDSGLAAAEAPCFERYTPEFNPHTGMGGMEIWIPLAS